MKENINIQGCLADAKLAAQNLILTQGGEPTFVPYDTTAPEWNLAALGPQKLKFARLMAQELTSTLFKGAVVMQSFGKHYPGEPLPRWQIGIYKSRSQAPLWNDLNRLRLGQETIAPGDPAMPKQFIADLAAELGLADTSLPAYEDLEAKLKSIGSDETTHLLPRFSRSKRAFISRPLPDDLDQKWQSYFEPAGWVLPLDHDDEKWSTGEWNLPDGDDLTLYPGDSPVGLRLPLHRLPEGAIRRGLSVELRDQELIVFLPPLPSFACFAELVRTIEKLTVKLNLPPIRLEGYTPPRDEDLESMALTSDPGVLEVNLPPADNWPDFERVIRGMYQSAESIGMRALKYQLSGRQVSTGGGAHIVMGGPDLDHNPFIERPNLLSSFLRFLQQHPSLSYAFSGLFIGPSSQAPRVDESAHELPYELEITLKGIEEMSQPGQPWMIDALLRNLLMDWNGNTHRAELSVDKFYNINTGNGRSGLIEFRAFEMVPEPEPLLAANVLLRALAACFAEKPFTSPLIDWRESLHDKFMLPYFLRQDLHSVIAYLNEHGFSFEQNVFEAQLDFRFPLVTQFSSGAIKWTLRHAIEPWPVMGEHEGTGRVVDSTTDRLELLAEGDFAQAGLIASVNGIRIPLQQVSEHSAVAGIRYRLFDNPWGLQPHITAHSPLNILIIEQASNKVVHAFDYVNWKLWGEKYDGLPSNQQEARARVGERLIDRSDLVGSEATVRDLPPSVRLLYTLDLRRQ
ncbi:transglutaminase family protein [Paraglaciecola sp.]|uniref:transglutaminase family protein n=1 Tax=Paraglaciecola sp. TaxID=1920173 RepID=UPI00273F1388|nr:transglutaminase family protein [Paraglaciecola sp.]MDP5032150.1 transglutaminase family protein [Paraglaciecola sp.]